MIIWITCNLTITPLAITHLETKFYSISYYRFYESGCRELFRVKDRSARAAKQRTMDQLLLHRSESPTRVHPSDIHSARLTRSLHSPPRQGDGRAPRRLRRGFLYLLRLSVERRGGRVVPGPARRARSVRASSRRRRPAGTTTTAAAVLGVGHPHRARRRAQAARGVRNRGAGTRGVDKAGRRASLPPRRVGESLPPAALHGPGKGTPDDDTDAVIRNLQVRSILPNR
jgi:hypothetical protein